MHGLASHEREALTGLLRRRGRSACSPRVQLPEIDETLRRACLAESLRHALTLLDGEIPDFDALRESAAGRQR